MAEFRVCEEREQRSPIAKEIGTLWIGENLVMTSAYARRPTVRTPATCKPMTNVTLDLAENN